KEVTVEAEIPALTAGKVSLWVRFRMFFADTVTGVKELATKVVKNLLGTGHKTDGGFDAAVERFYADAEQFGIRLQVEIYEGAPVRNMLLDVLEVKRTRDRTHEPGRRADDVSA